MSKNLNPTSIFPLRSLYLALIFSKIIMWVSMFRWRGEVGGGGREADIGATFEHFFVPTLWGF